MNEGVGYVYKFLVSFNDFLIIWDGFTDNTVLRLIRFKFEGAFKSSQFLNWTWNQSFEDKSRIQVCENAVWAKVLNSWDFRMWSFKSFRKALHMFNN